MSERRNHHLLVTAQAMGYYPLPKHMHLIDRRSVKLHSAKWEYVYEMPKGTKRARELRRRANTDIDNSDRQAIRDVMEQALADVALAAEKRNAAMAAGI